MRIVGGKFRGRQLTEVADISIRPTSDRLRETIFNILCHWTMGDPGDKRVADVFAGTGAMGLEALSRGAEHVTFVEKHQRSLSILKVNISLLKCEKDTDVVAASARNLPSANEPYDLIFLDPPYGKRLLEPALQSLYENCWLKPSCVIVIEAGRSENFIPPAWLDMVDERTSGKTKILLARVI